MIRPLSDALELVGVCIHFGDDTEIEELPEGLEELWELRTGLDRVISTARKLKTAVEQAMAQDLGEGNSIRLGGDWISAQPSRTFRIHNPDGLFDWLGLDARLAFNPNTVRVGSLRAIAEQRELNPGVIETFGEYEDGPGTITVKPIDRAPLYVKDFEHGQKKERKS